MGLLAVPSSKGARAERESAYYDRYGENNKQNSVTGFKGFAHGKDLAGTWCERAIVRER